MIEITNVSKRFEGVEALKNLTLRIPEGEVFGLVGTNGAGKSTLLRLLCGVLRQDEGDILIDGKRVWENEEIKQIYKDFLDKPGSHLAHELLHTTYQKREKYSK